ncbi:MAG: cadherin domain-containing protein, partial [Arenicellales bacterium]|nr:cadherin domain-containing protein [Arenicellales bacterium]
MDEDATSTALDISTPTDADGDSLTITVTAVPTGGTLTMTDGTEVTVNSTLTISQLTGLVFTPDANLNDDNTDFGTFTYRVSDGSLTDTGTVTISVTPVQDAPELVGVMEFAIDENTTAVADITATDVDDDTLTYSITGGDDQALFAIDSSTGTLSFIDRPDYENPADTDQDNIYSVEVTVSDGNGGSASQTYVITVNDVITHVAITNTAIDENDAGAMVGTLSAAIDDINATHEYTYTLSGDDADSFEVVDGQLKLKDGVSANYEVQNSYAVTVTATGSGGLTTSEDFTVTINDLNDA